MAPGPIPSLNPDDFHLQFIEINHLENRTAGFVYSFQNASPETVCIDARRPDRRGIQLTRASDSAMLQTSLPSYEATVADMQKEELPAGKTIVITEVIDPVEFLLFYGPDNQPIGKFSGSEPLIAEVTMAGFPCRLTAEFRLRSQIGEILITSKAPKPFRFR
jgi:hypothetical protein